MSPGKQESLHATQPSHFATLLTREIHCSLSTRGSRLEMLTLRPHPRLTEPESAVQHDPQGNPMQFNFQKCCFGTLTLELGCTLVSAGKLPQCQCLGPPAETVVIGWGCGPGIGGGNYKSSPGDAIFQLRLRATTFKGPVLLNQRFFLGQYGHVLKGPFQHLFDI